MTHLEALEKIGIDGRQQIDDWIPWEGDYQPYLKENGEEEYTSGENSGDVLSFGIEVGHFGAAKIAREALNIRLSRDGNKWCITRRDFINLQESAAGFGDTPRAAYDNLLASEATR